jgi:hypothetical protein
MKKTSFKIQIDQPCHEEKENMDKIDVGHYCHSCKKNVIDFRDKLPTEIADFFMHNKDVETCGTFYESQLEEDYIHFETEKKSNLKYAAGFLIGMLLAQNDYAQTTGMIKTQPRVVKSKLKIGLIENADTTSTLKNNAIDSIKEVNTSIRGDVNIQPQPSIQGGARPIKFGKVAPVKKNNR